MEKYVRNSAVVLYKKLIKELTKTFEVLLIMEFVCFFLSGTLKCLCLNMII